MAQLAAWLAAAAAILCLARPDSMAWARGVAFETIERVVELRASVDTSRGASGFRIGRAAMLSSSAPAGVATDLVTAELLRSPDEGPP